MPHSSSGADNLNEQQPDQKKTKKREHCLTRFELQWNSFHRWPLAAIWLLRQRDGRIHVVPFEICSCVMPTRAEYCQSTKAVTLSCSFSHTRRYTLLSGWPWPCVWHHLGLLRLTMNAKPTEAFPKCQIVLFHTISNTSWTVQLNTFSEMSYSSNYNSSEAILYL